MHQNVIICVVVVVVCITDESRKEKRLRSGKPVAGPMPRYPRTLSLFRNSLRAVVNIVCRQNGFVAVVLFLPLTVAGVVPRPVIILMFMIFCFRVCHCIVWFSGSSICRSVENTS